LGAFLGAFAIHSESRAVAMPLPRPTKITFGEMRASGPKILAAFRQDIEGVELHLGIVLARIASQTTAFSLPIDGSVKRFFRRITSSTQRPADLLERS
jgi:hypothetical protein